MSNLGTLLFRPTPEDSKVTSISVTTAKKKKKRENLIKNLTRPGNSTGEIQNEMGAQDSGQLILLF